MAYVGVKPAAITSATQAEIAGDLTVDTTTLVVDATNNRVGMGIASAEATLDLVGNSDSVAALKIGPNASFGHHFYDSSTNGDLVVKREVSGTQTEVMRLTRANGLARFSEGVLFGTDTAAANALDDYEEGTWTPTDATGSGVTWTTHSARYTKIGRIVNVQLYVSGISSSAASADAKISGLPYNVVNHGWTSSALSTNAGQSSSQDIVARSVSNSDDIDFKGASTDANIAWSHFHGAFMVFKLTYHVS